MTDSQLIREIKDGNTELYAELIRRYDRKIHAFIYHMLKSAHLESMAEDLCQETFYKAYRSLDTFREVEASFSTWLYTIARNTVLSELRKQRNNQLSLEEAHYTPEASREVIPEYAALAQERAGLVRKAINNLPEKQRSALILREYEQLDYQEIANLLGQSVSSIKSLLFRARAGIRAQLESYVADSHVQDIGG